MTEFTAAVYENTKKIPRGMVANYGLIAFLSGKPRAARAVGFALHNNPEPGITPCHRVVFKDGSVCPGFAFGGAEVQRAMLLDEGVAFLPDGRVDMTVSGWSGD